MRILRYSVPVLTFLLLGLSAEVSAKSSKRGICWDEHNVALNTDHASLFSPGVSWAYNWGPDAACPEAYGPELNFLPMAWNGTYNATRIRAWLEAHPESRYLLGFNEPNFSDQARMTPAEAAEAWPALEALAAKFGVKLVAPALNFSASQVGGRVWNPYEWYDEFFRIYPGARVDCLAMHCYMNWYTANTWLATEYFYADLYNPEKECYGRYPNLVKYLDDFKAANGHFPRMMLTEFCSWENDGTIKDVNFQIDQMTQKVQKLEQSDLVEGYAWFMANSGGGASAYPYMSLLERNTADSPLSDLGKVYVGMSDFDTERHYGPGEVIAAKSYVDATTDDRVIRVRPNSEPASDIDLQIEIPAAGYAHYLVDIPADGDYKFLFHIKADAATSVTLYVDNKKNTSAKVEPTSGAWMDAELSATLTEGKHRIMPYNSGSSPLLMNSLSYTATNGIGSVQIADHVTISSIYDLGGRCLGNPELSTLARGVYMAQLSDGTTVKFIF